MSDTVTISLIGAASTVVISLVNAGLALMSHDRGKRNEQTLVDLKQQTNGIQEKLVKVTGEAEFAKGVQSEKDKPK